MQTLNRSFADVQRGVFFLLSNMSVRAIGYVENQHPINALNAICLNSFRIKSAQSSGRRL